jgi:site-specific recombinase XerD
LKTARLTIADVTPERVAGFLDWVEEERGCGPATRNLRLSAVKTFFAYVQPREPALMSACQAVLAIPAKKTPEAVVDYLTLGEVKALLEAVGRARPAGFRDLVMLSVLYDTAARVQELVDLDRSDVRLAEPASAFLTGKGNKRRRVPLMGPTVGLLEAHLDAPGRPDVGAPLFANRVGARLTRSGVAHILRKHVGAAKAANPGLFQVRTSPHTLRHSKAVHLLQSGVPLIYIRDFLGHVHIGTTEVYARCDSTAVRNAVAEANQIPADAVEPVWQREAGLLAWLDSLSG